MDDIAKGEITLVTTIGTIIQEPIIYQSHCNSFQKSGFQGNGIDLGKVKNWYYGSFKIVNWALSNFCYCPINLGKSTYISKLDYDLLNDLLPTYLLKPFKMPLIINISYFWALSLG